MSLALLAEAASEGAEADATRAEAESILGETRLEQEVKWADPYTDPYIRIRIELGPLL